MGIFYLYLLLNNLNNNIMTLITALGLIVAAAIVGFVVGIFVYRNNVVLFGPIADRLDAHEDNLEEMVKEIKAQIESIKASIK